MIEESYRTYNPEFITVRLSTPFLARSKCKFCDGAPLIYYYVRNPTLWYNPRRVTNQLQMVKKYVKRLGMNHFMFDDPKYFTETAIFGHTPSYKGYNPKLHRTRGANPTFDIIEFLTCECGLATWAFTEKAVKHRPEIMNRKSRHNFPHKFEF